MKSDKKFIVLNTVESTNNYANQLVLSKAAGHGTVVLAQFQSKGKGQMGNSWESEYGKNLLASFVLLPVFLPAVKQFYLSKITCLSISEFLKPETKSVSVKWPNDIYIGNKKVAGILIENSIKNNYVDSSIIGIGLNLNQEHFISDAPNPVSLKNITGRNYDVHQVAAKIDEILHHWLEKLRLGNYEEIDTTYFNQLFRSNEWALFAKQGIRFEAKITGIGEFGQLILENRNGTTSEFMFKEVEFVI